MKCGSKLPQNNLFSFMPSGFYDMINAFTTLGSSFSKFEENQLVAQGVDMEKYREKQKELRLSPEEMKGKSLLEAQFLQLDKQETQIRKDYKEKEKKLAVEFFHAVKPKFQVLEPDREKMLERLREYVLQKYKETVKGSAYIMTQFGNTDKSTYTKPVETIEELIKYTPKSNPPPMTEVPLLTFKNAYTEASALIDEYCECCKTGKKMREFSYGDENLSNSFMPQKSETDKPSVKTRVIE
jgi:hypothetical protein